MKNLKVGDKVKIKQDLVLGEVYNHCGYHAPMEKYAGKVATITNVVQDSEAEVNYNLDIDKGKWFWDSEMIEPVEEVEYKTCNEKDSTRLAKAVCEYEEIVHNLEKELNNMLENKNTYKAMYQEMLDRHTNLLDEYNTLVDEYNELVDEYNSLI